MFCDPENYSQLAAASFGQTFNITPLQLVTAVSACVNGGYLMQPHLVERIVDAEGNTVYDTAVTLNGEEADAELLTTLTTRLNALTASGDLPDGWTCPRTRRRAGASFSPRWAAPRVRSPPTAGRLFRRIGSGRRGHPLRA